MRTALPSPRFLVDQTAERRRKRAEMRARVRDKTFMGITHELGMACGEALNQAVACTPRMRQLYRQRPEVRADLRRRWRRAFEQVRARQRQVPYHAVAGRSPDEVTLEARRNPNAFVEHVLRTSKTEVGAGGDWWRHLGGQNKVILAPAGAGMSGQLSTWRTKLDALWLARHLAENPGARVGIVTTSERGADQLIQATKRAWNQQSLGDRLLKHFRDAPPDPEAQAYIDAHAVDDIAPPTMEQRLADVSDGIWRRMIQRVADERGW